MELTAFFPMPERASAALDLLGQAGFDVNGASLVTGEDATTALHKRLAAAKRGRAAAGALAGGALSLLLSAGLVLPTPGPIPWLAVVSFVALAGLLGAAVGGYYGMGVEKESVLVGVVVAKHRLDEAIYILRGAGGRFIHARPLASEQRPLTGQRAPTFIRSNR